VSGADRDYRCQTPVAFLVFNRPDVTQRVFEAIARAKPPRLFVIADGARENRAGEKERCEAVRRIFDKVDWDCEVLTNYSESNMGCAPRVASGIDWVFANAEEAIVLEDDCLPHPTFFRFCDEMLERYREDERVMTVSGDNFQFGAQRWEYSYYFSRYVHVWGWATWRRAWNHFDLKMAHWPMIRSGGWLNDIIDDDREARFWAQAFEQAYQGKSSAWSYQWILACWLRSALSVLPNVNLVSNIGFGEEATHTSGKSKVANMDVQELKFPLVHPPVLIRDSQADRRAAELFFRPSVLSLTKSLFRRWIGRGR